MAAIQPHKSKVENGNVVEQRIFQSGEDCKTKWTQANAQFTETDSHLEIMGKPVMERWETPYMHKLGSIAASNGKLWELNHIYS